jgi:hypothetical protein
LALIVSRKVPLPGGGAACGSGAAIKPEVEAVSSLGNRRVSSRPLRLSSTRSE